MKIKIAATTLLLLALGISTVSASEQNDITMLMQSKSALVNGKQEDIPAPLLQGGTTMVPVRFLSESIGLTVTWNDILKKVDVKNGTHYMSFALNQTRMNIDGKAVTLPEAAKLINNSTYVPLRAFMEALGKVVSYQDGIITIGKTKIEFSNEKLSDIKNQLSIGYAFSVFQNNNLLRYFSEFGDAVDYAKNYANSKVDYQRREMVWDNQKVLPSSKRITGVKAIYQMPELPRGCEVTSLAMMLNFAGINVNKMDLARQVEKDPTPYSKTNGQVRFGNPYNGFVGDMYSFSKPGLAVYHGPIADLAERYLPGRIVDMTGSSFDSIIYALSKGTPVWTIINVNFKPIAKSSWQHWETPTGDIDITYKEHSVLLTGYDENYVFISDPLGNVTKASRSLFESGWIQMGKQAITYTSK